MEYRFTAENFEAEVLNSEIPVLVDFNADWCGPCKMLGPIVESIAEDYEGKVKVGKVNADDDPELCAKYGVQSIPNIKIFKGGQIVDESVGMTGQEQLEDKLDALL